MKRTRLLGIGMLAPFAFGLYLDGRMADGARQTTVNRIDPTAVTMMAAPIPSDWLIDGKPTTVASEIAHTDDGTTKVFVWQTTKARFHWFYQSDEIIHVIDGDVFIADGDGPERHFGPGDVAFFPAGARTTWRVPDHLRKIAMVKRPLLAPMASVLRWGRIAKALMQPESAFAGN